MRVFLYSFACLPPLLLSEQAIALPGSIPGSGSVSQEIDASRPKAQPQRDSAPVITQQDEQPISLPSDETLHVNSFRLEGAEFIPPAELQAALSPYQGRALTLAQIEEAAGKVTALYRSRGYMVARAYVPEQDASGGVLTIHVLTGQYGAFHIENHSLVRTSKLQSTFDSLQSRPAVTRDDLQRTMLLSSDLSGTQMPQLAISPGEKQGSSDFAVKVDPADRVNGYVLADNLGSRYTGHNRLSAGMDINSPFGLGDKISLSGLTSENTHLMNGALGYSLPLTDNGLKGNISLYRTIYELGQEYKDLDATGSDTGATAGLSYPLIRSQDHNLNIYGNVTAKRLIDNIGITNEETKKHAWVGTIGAENNQWNTLSGHNLYTSEALSLTYGHLSFADQQQREQNQLGADTDGNFYHLNLALQGNYALSENFSTGLILNAQKALGNKNLDGSEQMSISGANAVSAFREVNSGDNALYLGGEVRYQLPDVISGLDHSIGLFAGTGWSNYENGDYTTARSTRLSDAGIGYNASYKQTVILKLQLAQAIGPITDEVYNDDRTHVLVQAGLLF